jgi:outer membrane lipoprotein-sorting protein
MSRPAAWLRALGALAALAACTASARGEGELSARAIMESVDARDDGDHSTQDLEMVLIDKRGSQRVRKLRAYGRDVGADEQSILFFVAPADVEDTGFLTYDYKDPARDDDQWLYLPALSRTKRIASADKSGSFMGSDFSYADMTKRPLDHYRYTLMKELEIDGHAVWQIESVPTTEQEREETGYTKSVVFVRKDNFVVVRSVNWVKKGDRLKYFEVKQLEQIDGIWVATEMNMATKKGDETLHRTILTAKNTRFGQKLGDDFFTVRQLEKGP